MEKKILIIFVFFETDLLFLEILLFGDFLLAIVDLFKQLLSYDLIGFKIRYIDICC